MTEAELNNKLINFGKYRITNNKNIDSSKKYDLFYFIIHDKNIYKSNHIKLINTEKLTNFIESTSLYEYIDKEILNNNHHLDKKYFKSYIYCIPREQITKEKYSILIDIVLKTDMESIPFKLKFLKNVNIDYTKIGTIFLLIYMSMSYMILSNSGFNIKNLDSLNIIISIIFFQVGSIISLLPSSFIVGLGLSKTSYFFLIIFVGFFILFKILKKYTIYYILSFSIYFLKYMIIFLIKIFFTLFISIGILYILYSPLAYSFDNFKLHTKFQDFSNDDKIFKLYLDKTGYPKILYKNEINNTNKKYILMGIESNNYLVYDIDKVVAYIKNIDSFINQNEKLGNKISIEQFCRNIHTTNDEIAVLYQILKNSTISKPRNIEWLNVDDSIITIKPFKFEEFNLNYNEINKKCIQLINRSNQEKDNN
ncbi:hypothetical protein N5U12_06175 [Aliarcobacter butzleri]|uniref:hypothetical protein n=1 Tax=Aliarcobacter TaxID=2321111 RepID=UPI0021B39672|nr:MULTISPECIES: hypothetical protein [Aliarcobacter]MCT7581564.1 hypothetical protein [Aliarcobacter butzleri]MDD2509047.1 hypothetical protein [Aliarcobacter skirrowii]MDD3497029.1 hypothetical protein [Aliarcobacter skirrowii]